MKYLATAGAAIAVLGLTGPMATVAAGTTITPAQPEAAVIAIDGCEHCAGLIERGKADLVVTTTLNNGDYVAMWQNKVGIGVYGQIYTREGQPRGSEFRIYASVEEGYLPIVYLQPGGGFVARWKRAGATYERHFDSFGIPLGAEARLK